MTNKDKVRVLPGSLPECFGFIALMADANNMQFDSICALLKSEIKLKTHIHSHNFNYFSSSDFKASYSVGFTKL